MASECREVAKLVDAAASSAESARPWDLIEGERKDLERAAAAPSGSVTGPSSFPPCSSTEIISISGISSRVTSSFTRAMYSSFLVMTILLFSYFLPKEIDK